MLYDLISLMYLDIRETEFVENMNMSIDPNILCEIGCKRLIPHENIQRKCPFSCFC